MNLVPLFLKKREKKMEYIIITGYGNIERPENRRQDTNNVKDLEEIIANAITNEDCVKITIWKEESK